MLRNKDGTVKEGAILNAGGRSRSLEHVRVMGLARERTEEALNTITEIMRDTGVNPGIRLAAAEALLSRGWGKPTQSVGIDISSMPDEELFSRAAVLFKKYGLTGGDDK